MKDPHLTDCPQQDCSGPVKRKIGAGAGFIFKGNGFYITDYRSDSYKAAAKKDSDSSSSASTPAPAKPAAITGDALGRFQSDDTSAGGLRARFLLAGLMGLGRVDTATARAFADTLKLDLARETRWTRAIDAAAESGNPTLVSLLAGFGMQGSGWDKMTPLHLYHIVAALRRAGLEGEARMIAAEAVARV
jgi:predicted nucleic acid-binding Zn ribbon protein